MPKYRIKMGSLVTKLMCRKFTVSAENEAEAIEKAEERFRKACKRHVYTECGDTVNVDSIVEVNDDV